MDYQHYTSFNLTDTKLGKTKNLTNDFGGIIINTNEEVYERECMPQINSITLKNDMMDGELFMDAKYGTRVIDMTILLNENGSDLLELKKWLGKKYQQVFNWDNDWEDKGIYIILNKQLESQVYYNRTFYCKLDLSFIAHNPYYFKLNDRNISFKNLTIGQEYVVKSKGNCNSYPLIKITPTTSNIIFSWNDLIITLNNLTGNPIFLDCEKYICYEVINNVKTSVLSKFYSNDCYEFPEINCEENNKIKLASGGISEILITPNTRFI